MSLHYNAFISYKHAELDNKVAAAIEWDLEHYHIPSKIQKKTGFKKIERIFRDKDELLKIFAQLRAERRDRQQGGEGERRQEEPGFPQPHPVGGKQIRHARSPPTRFR